MADVVSGAACVVRALEGEGVRLVFGHPGGPVLPLYDELSKSGVRHVLVRHEEAGAFMADAYAKATGRPGVCISTMGPGASNMVIGVATAFSDSSPVVAITGQLSTKVLWRGNQQEMDHVSLFRGITKLSMQVTRADKLPEAMARAFRVATTGRQGPVHIDLPRDVQQEEVEVEELQLHRWRASTEARAYPSPELAKRAVEMLVEAEAPIILAGGGVISSEASPELTTLTELLNIPVATSFNGRGAIREDHPLSLGRAGEYTPPYVGQAVSEADMLFAVGYRFTDVSTEGWRPRRGARIVQVDIDPSEIGKNLPVDLGVVGDAKAMLTQMVGAAKGVQAKASRRAWLDQVENLKREWWAQYEARMTSDAVPIKPQRVMGELKALLRRDAMVSAEAGRSKMWVASLLPIYEPRTWIHSGGFAPMGYALCAAIGAKLARPERQAVAVCGDAAFQMVCQELATAVENQAPIVAIVINDGCLGSIRLAQLRNYGHAFATEFRHDVNLAEVARAFGAMGERIEKPQEIRPALETALRADKPTVLDVVVDRNENPPTPLAPGTMDIA